MEIICENGKVLLLCQDWNLFPFIISVIIHYYELL